MGIHKHTRHGMSISKDDNGRSNIYSNVFESIIGAIYVDSKYDFNKVFEIFKSWNLQLNLGTDVRGERGAAAGESCGTATDRFVDDVISTSNPRQILQEHLQKLGLPLPSYRLEKKEGSDHAPLFTYICMIEYSDGVKEASGVGSSKKLAEKNAAENLIKLLGDIGGSDGSI
jgi:dsRNA-specific ribonuclease